MCRHGSSGARRSCQSSEVHNCKPKSAMTQVPSALTKYFRLDTVRWPAALSAEYFRVQVNQPVKWRTNIATASRSGQWWQPLPQGAGAPRQRDIVQVIIQGPALIKCGSPATAGAEVIWLVQSDPVTLTFHVAAAR